LNNTPASFAELLRTLRGFECDFVVVGAVAAVLSGSPIMTTDLDVVFERSEANLTRLLAALNDLEAVYRDPAGRRIEPSLDRLRAMQLHLLSTRLGNLDLLTAIGPNWDHAALLTRSTRVDVAGVSVRVLDLDAVIESKIFANRPKDVAILPVLREVLALRRHLDEKR
jgi:hypothetical protein